MWIHLSSRQPCLNIFAIPQYETAWPKTQGCVMLDYINYTSCYLLFLISSNLMIQLTLKLLDPCCAQTFSPQDLVDSTLFCLVYLLHFVWFREVNQAKPNLFQPKNFLSIFKNEIFWPPLNPLGPNINLLNWYFPPKSDFNLFLTCFNQGIYFTKIFPWFDSGWD